MEEEGVAESRNQETETAEDKGYELCEALPLDRNLDEIGGQAVWSVTTAKAGNGVELLRDGKEDTYWQSDGGPPHLINVQFQKKVRLQLVAIYLDSKADDSYTPQRISIRAGSNYYDLKEIKGIELSTPQGWVVVHTKPPHPQDTKEYLKAFFLQVAVLRNHQHGRDSHIRQIRVFGPRQESVNVQGGQINIATNDFMSYCTIR